LFSTGEADVLEGPWRGHLVVTPVNLYLLVQSNQQTLHPSREFQITVGVIRVASQYDENSLLNSGHSNRQRQRVFRPQRFP
jgi:hypothetical protein